MSSIALSANVHWVDNVVGERQCCCCAVQSYSGHAALLGSGAVPSAGGPEPGAAKYSAFNLKAYRKYFNVDTQARFQLRLLRYNNAWSGNPLVPEGA